MKWLPLLLLPLIPIAPKSKPVTDCRIGHIIKTWTAGNNQHFHGVFEERVGLVIDLSVMVPTWPEDKPHVLMCIRIDTIGYD